MSIKENLRQFFKIERRKEGRFEEILKASFEISLEQAIKQLGLEYVSFPTNKKIEEYQSELAVKLGISKYEDKWLDKSQNICNDMFYLQDKGSVYSNRSIAMYKLFIMNEELLTYEKELSEAKQKSENNKKEGWNSNTKLDELLSKNK